MVRNTKHGFHYFLFQPLANQVTECLATDIEVMGLNPLKLNLTY